MQTNSIATITHSPWYRRAIVALAGLLIAGSVGVGLMSRSHSGAALAPAVSARAPLAAAQVERQTALKQRQLDQLDAQLTSAAAPAPHPIQAERFTTLKQRQLDQLDARLSSVRAPAAHAIQVERFTTLKQRQLDQLDRHRR